MKILIVGADLNALLLAKYIKTQIKGHDIYLTTEIQDNDEIYTPVDIKENDIEAICDFVKYNQIELTIVTSQLAIINGIAETFEKEGFPIAAPSSEAARVTLFNSIAKKVMYKLKTNTPRFGIFDRENIAVDYIRRAKFPIVIKNDFTLSEKNYTVYKSYRQAKIALQKIFENENEKIVIENYIDETPVYIYFFTDGYNALPLISIEKKYYEKFIQSIAPCKKLTEEKIRNILRKAVFPLLDDIAKYSGNYSGVLGMKITFKDNNFYVIEYYNGFQDYDLQVFLSLLDEDIVEIYKDIAKKQLNERNYIELDEKYSYTIAVEKSEIITEVDDEDYFIIEDNKNVVITKTASTMNLAKKHIDEYLETICEENTYKEIINLTGEALRI